MVRGRWVMYLAHGGQWRSSRPFLGLVCFKSQTQKWPHMVKTATYELHLVLVWLFIYKYNYTLWSGTALAEA